MTRRRGSGSLFKQPGCSTWTMSYYRGGKRYRESTGETDYQAARQALNRKLGKIAEGRFTEPKLDRIRVAELMTDWFRHQRVDKHGKDVEREESRWKNHPEPFFGSMLAAQITSASLNAYVDERLEAGASAGTINRELAILRGALRYAAESEPPKVLRVPKFPRLKEADPRKGFVDDAQFERLKKHAPELWLRAALEIGYEHGWRRGELLGLRVRHVNLLDRTINLDAGSTKNGGGRTVVMNQDELALLTALVHGKGPEDFVLTDEQGQSISKSAFWWRWDRLRQEAGFPRLLFHDLRRCAVRNMVRAGISEKVAMTISGHRTRNIFDRYNIVNERDLKEAAEKSRKRREDAAAQFGHDFGHDSATTPQPSSGNVN